MRRSLLPIVAFLAMTLPMVSGCSPKKEAPPVKVVLKEFTSVEDGFSVQLFEPHLEKTTEVGKLYYFNCADGTYKLFVSSAPLSQTNPAKPVRELRDQKVIDALSNHAGTYVGSMDAQSNKRFKLNFKYNGFETKGLTGANFGNADGRQHLIIKLADNDIALKENTNTGEYIVRGYVGENAVYVLSVEGKPEFVNSPTVTEFFESFKINGPATVTKY